MKQRGRKSAAALSVIGTAPVVHRPSYEPPTPPKHLDDPERQLWHDIFRDYNLASLASDAVLVTTLEAHQRARQAREQIDRDGMTIIGRDKQIKVHPLLAVERDARQQWLAGLKALGLEL